MGKTHNLKEYKQAKILEKDLKQKNLDTIMGKLF